MAAKKSEPTTEATIEPATDDITVRLTAAQWQELVGMTTQGVQLILSQLAMQPGTLSQTRKLNVVADDLINEIKGQLPQ